MGEVWFVWGILSLVWIVSIIWAAQARRGAGAWIARGALAACVAAVFWTAAPVVGPAVWFLALLLIWAGAGWAIFTASR